MKNLQRPNPVMWLQRRLGLNRRQLAARLGLSVPYLGDVDAGVVKDPRKFNAAVAALNLDLVEEGNANA